MELAGAVGALAAPKSNERPLKSSCSSLIWNKQDESEFLLTGRLVQRCPCGERIHVISPAHDFAVLNRGDRDKPVVIGRISGDYLPMHFVFEGHDPTVLGRMHEQRIASIESDVVPISGIERYEVVAASCYPWPARKFIEKLKYHVVGEGVKIVLT